MFFSPLGKGTSNTGDVLWAKIHQQRVQLGLLSKDHNLSTFILGPNNAWYQISITRFFLNCNSKFAKAKFMSHIFIVCVRHNSLSLSLSHTVHSGKFHVRFISLNVKVLAIAAQNRIRVDKLYTNWAGKFKCQKATG